MGGPNLMQSGVTMMIVKNDFDMLAGKLDQQAGEIVKETCLFIEGQAKRDAPIDTGALANSIMQDVARYDQGWVGVVSATSDHAAFVNYGTGSRGASSSVPERPAEISYTNSWLGMVARPFMSQAGVDGKARFESAMKNVL